MPDLPDPAPRAGARGSWNVVREVVDAGVLWSRETWLVDLTRDRAIDEADALQADVSAGVSFIVESADGLRRIELR